MNTNQNQTLRNINRQSLRMLLVQCVVIIITGAHFSIGWLYVSLTSNQNIIQVAKNNLLTDVVGYLSVTGSCISFYLFNLSSSLFRRQLRPLFKWCLCCNRVQPINPTTEAISYLSISDLSHRFLLIQNYFITFTFANNMMEYFNQMKTIKLLSYIYLCFYIPSYIDLLFIIVFIFCHTRFIIFFTLFSLH
jgi:hypothetical protein